MGKKSFTLMELMITLVVIGIIAGFAIPNYNRALEKSVEKKAILDLGVIRSGWLIYRAKTGATTMPSLASRTAINNKFKLAVTRHPDLDFVCGPVHAGTFMNYCKVTNGDWIIHFHDDEPLHCDNGGGPCPTCEGTHIGGGSGCPNSL